MKANTQKSNWLIDALLFTGFLVAFVLDLTGLAMHQWLGVLIGFFAVFHLTLHWDWAITVTTRFFGKTSGRARLYYLLDAALMLGFYLIVTTGLVISTWFNLNLSNYAAWAAFHKFISYATLALVVLKIGLHWRWIVRVARQSVFPASQPVPAVKPALLLAPRPTPVTRRDFLKLMGVVGAASALAFAAGLKGEDDGQDTAKAASSASTNVTADQPAVPTAAPTVSAPTATSESVSVAVPTPTIAPTATTEPVKVIEIVPTATTATTTVTTACVGRCPKNKHCAFPGECRRYQDTNGNGRCDLGECA